MLSQQQLTSLCEKLTGDAQTEWERLHFFSRYYRGHHDKPQFSPRVEQEYGNLWKASTVNHMQLAVKAPTQRLAVDGYRGSREDPTNAPPWLQWQASGMDRRQHPLFASAAKYGYAYTSVLPAGAGQARIRPFSPRSVYCDYANTDDEWPRYAIQRRKPKGGPAQVTLWDTNGDMYVLREAVGGKLGLASYQESATGVVPFVRFLWSDDLDDDCPPVGEIEPLIKLQDQLNRVTFIINLIGEKTSFTIKWMTGVEFPNDPVTGKPMSPWRSLPGEIWALAQEEAKMGQFSPDNPSAFIAWRDTLKRDLFSLAQIPPHYGDNQMVNISADALAAAEATLDQKIDDLHDTLGESAEQALRLAALSAGDSASASDISSQVWWRDSSTRSLAATVDAAGKAVQMLGVPQEAAWLWIPGVTWQDVEDWKQLNQRNQGATILAQLAQKIQDGKTLQDGESAVTGQAVGSAR